MDLTNENEDLRRVLVTGARGALGTAVVNQYLEAGCTVIGTDRLLNHEGIFPDHERHRLHWTRMDVTHPLEVATGIHEITEQFGAIDALIHCAGGFRFAHADTIGNIDIEFLLDVNLKSSVLLVREAVRAMKDQNFGRIVLVSSVSTLHPSGGTSAYTASKAGVNALVEAVSAELRPTDININAVLPSVIDTPANRRDMPDADFDSWVNAIDLANIIFMLTQPLMSPVRGALIPVRAGT